MPNKSSPHGGFITEGTVSHGTLRQQDLLRSFASELERVFPFNGAALVSEARTYADKIDTICGATDDDFARADDVLSSLVDQLDTIAGREGLYFGTLEGDGSDFGFWREGSDGLDSDGYPLGEPREWSEDELAELRRRERACDNYGSD